MKKNSEEKNRLVFLTALSVGILAANIYYSQPILNLLAQSLSLRADAAGLLMTLTQIGYGIGVLLVVPLGDFVENRRLILTLVVLAIFGNLTLGLVPYPVPYYFASVAVGLGASAVQILIPFTSAFFSKEERGKVLGEIMSGLMLGIMLSRPLSSLIANFVALHGVFIFSAGIMSILLFVLYRNLPSRLPNNTKIKYLHLIWSMHKLFINTPTLRRRGAYQAMMFGAFCFFWTVTPIMLTQSEFHFSQKDVAIFALLGLAGTVVAPLAGKSADRGFERTTTSLAFIAGILCFLLSAFVNEIADSRQHRTLSLVMLVITANLVDAGVSAHLVLGQRAIFIIDPKNQSRLNGLYIGTTYIGGAIGSAAAAWSYSHYGWAKSMAIGACFPIVALALQRSEKFFGYKE